MRDNRSKVSRRSATPPVRPSPLKLEESKQILSQYSISSSATKFGAIAKKRNRIVDGACQVFFRKGFNRTSIREIAQACGMSMGQIYHYISSKDDILFLVHKHMHELWINNLIDSGVGDIADPKLRLERAIRATVELIIENRKLFQFVYTETKHLAKEHLKTVLEIDEKIVLSFWRNLLQEFEMKPILQKKMALAASLVAFVCVFEALRGWTVKDTSREEIANFVTVFILEGLGFKGLQ
jgi:AcrR family transcriptional regulator